MVESIMYVAHMFALVSFVAILMAVGMLLSFVIGLIIGKITYELSERFIEWAKNFLKKDQ